MSETLYRDLTTCDTGPVPFVSGTGCCAECMAVKCKIERIEESSYNGCSRLLLFEGNVLHRYIPEASDDKGTGTRKAKGNKAARMRGKVSQLS